MDRQEILNRLMAFPYDRDEYWVITGSAMVMYGIKEQAGDIDLGCSVKMADLLESDGYLYGRTKDGNRWFKVGESIEIFESWLYGSTIKMEGFRVISLNGLIEMKEKIGREKDFKDIALIKSFLKVKEELYSGDLPANEVKKMVCFLTSSPVIPGTDTLNPTNSFIEELHRHFPKDCQALFVCSDPDLYDKTDFFANETKRIFENAGFLFGGFRILDRRNEHKASELVKNSGLIILAGGHVPTQNRFFSKIGLRALLKDYNGILIGISAGSMNSAETVYAQPERDGEAMDSAYQRFLPGLGLTKTMLLPHYQENKDDILDGLRVYEDIAFSDSYGNVFYAIPDGTYLLIEGGKEELRGEAYRISNGNMLQVSKANDIVRL